MCESKWTSSLMNDERVCLHYLIQGEEYASIVQVQAEYLCYLIRNVLY